MRLSRLLAGLLALAIAAQAPAQTIVGSAAFASAWGNAAAATGAALSVDPQLSAQTPGLTRLLGQIRLEQTLHPGSRGAVALVDRLPAALAASPEAFAALPLAERVSALAAAAERTRAELEPQAAAFLKGPDWSAPGAPASDRRARLRALSESWFYLPPEQGQELLALRLAQDAADGKRALSLARRMAAKLGLGPATEEQALVMAELKQAFAGAQTLAASPDAERPDFVGRTLAPYMSRALDEAGARLEERGVESWRLRSNLLAPTSHRGVFGVIAPRPLVERLRETGGWTELVSALSLDAAEKLAGVEDEQPGRVLRAAGDSEDMRLAIPAWHPLAGRYATVAEALAESFGPADPAPAPPGARRIGSLSGIPIYLKQSVFAAAALLAFQIQPLLHRLEPHAPAGVILAQAVSSGALLYAGVLLHELGHAFAARFFGQRVRSIALNALGGATTISLTRRGWAQFVVAVAGPAAGAAAAALALGLVHAALLPRAAGLALVLAASWTIQLSVLNLLPFAPFDGGRALLGLLTLGLRDSYRAARAVAWLSRAFGAVMLAAAAVIAPFGLVSAVVLAITGVLSLIAGRSVGAHPGTTLVDEARTAAQDSKAPGSVK